MRCIVLSLAALAVPIAPPHAAPEPCKPRPEIKIEQRHIQHLLGSAAETVKPTYVIDFASRCGRAKYVIEYARDRGDWEHDPSQAALETALAAERAVEK